MTEELTVRLAGRVAAVRAAADAGPGHGAGLDEAGMREARQSIEAEKGRLIQACRALDGGLAELDRLRREIIAEAEEQLLELALEIARKVLMQEIHAGRYEIDPIVKEALLHVPPRRDVVVHMHPDDWAACEMAREEVSAPAGSHLSAEAPGNSGSLRFVADPGVRPGECLLETSEGRVESSVETHLQGIAEALKEESPNAEARELGPALE